MSDLKIISSGLYTTIQDLGRYGYRSQGIPLAGAMDQAAAKLANVLVGNNEDDALLECTMLGPKIEFNCNTYIAITGAQVDIYINSINQKLNSTLEIKKGDILKFGRIHQGCRFYIALAGGIDIPKILNSRSTDTISKIGLPPIEKNQIYQLNSSTIQRQFITISPIQDNLVSRKIKVYPGPEFNLIQNLDLNELEFEIQNSSNRMAYILLIKTPIIHNSEIISSGVLPGTIQLTPGGQFNVLMRDSQTTGGYPRVLQIIEDDLDYLAQCRGGDKIHFQITEI